jgi:Ca-activated chloride channel family protein
VNKILIILFLSITLVSSAQSPQAEKNIREGNEFYKQQQFEKASSSYSKALEAEPENGPAKFNLANTLYKQNKKEEAVKAFTELVDHTGKGAFKEEAFYNKGAVLSRQQKLEESIEAYKNALRLNPGDQEARENLQKALLELKKKNPPKKKEELDKKKKEQQKQSQSKMSPKEAQQRLQLLAQKEKEVRQRIQKEKSKPGGNQTKDW